MIRKLDLELKTYNRKGFTNLYPYESSRLCVSVLHPCLVLYAWDFVFAAQTGGQSCRLVVTESIFGHVYNACVGVCTYQVK